MERQDSFEQRGTRFFWDPPLRRLRVVYGPEPLTGADADVVLPRVTSWVDAVPSFSMLVDTTHVTEIPLSWRSAWVGWFSARRQRMRVAVVGAERLEALTIPVFAWMSGVDIRTFSDPAAAEGWLGAAESF